MGPWCQVEEVQTWKPQLVIISSLYVNFSYNNASPNQQQLVKTLYLSLQTKYNIRKMESIGIREAAIGNHEVSETKTKTIKVKGKVLEDATEITTVTKQLRPQWQAAAWFLERKYPEKYAQRRIIEGELPKDTPYEVFMTAKHLLQLPKIELDKIITPSGIR